MKFSIQTKALVLVHPSAVISKINASSKVFCYLDYRNPINDTYTTLENATKFTTIADALNQDPNNTHKVFEVSVQSKVTLNEDKVINELRQNKDNEGLEREMRFRLYQNLKKEFEK